MIKVEEAKKLILKEVKTLDIEEINILESLKRISAQDIYSPLDIPHFDNSAVDGYALKFEDTKGAESNPKVLNIIDEIPAGIIPKKSIRSGEVMRIFTGAIIPKGANAVIMQENTEKLNHEVKIFKELTNRENIRFQGEDLKNGNLILEKNTPLGAASIGILASIGISKIKVFKKPIVSILATGDELIEIEEKLILGKVRNSNTYSLASQIKQSGGIPLILGIAKDKEEEIIKKIKQGLNKSDILLTSAGISVGDYDFVLNSLKHLGVKINFWKVAMRPGKPLSFGTYQNKLVFGLPGNPVSSMISFIQFVQPAIFKMQGRKNYFPKQIKAVLGEKINKKAGLRYFLRTYLTYENEKFQACLTGPQGSGILSSMLLAHGIMIIPEEIISLNKGEKVEVELIDPDYFFLN